ncbi:MAG: Crp/Fnr family transcriptional regulator [Calditrichia bacterium]
MLTTIEKVIFLQDVDIFKFTSTQDLAHVAAITEEVAFTKEEPIYKEGDLSDSMYLIIEGSVALRRDGNNLLIAGPKDVFGTWALFDDEPRVVTALPLEETRLLRINKDDFFELLADHSEITQGILKTIVKRLRGLIDRIQIGGKSGMDE